MHKTVILGAGGTAGHIYPAVAIAEGLTALGLANSDLIFVTSSRQVEDTIFSDLPYNRIILQAEGLQKRDLKSAIKFGLSLVRSIVVLRKRLRRLDVGVAIVFGGYISIATAIAARSLRIQVVVIETNAVLGKANLVASALAATTFRSFEIKETSNTLVSGVPLREAVTEFKPSLDDRAKLLEKLGLEPARVESLVVVFGGSLGSLVINTAITEMLEGGLGSRLEKTAFYVLTGSRDMDRFGSPLKGLKARDDRLVAFASYDPDLFRVLALSDLAVCRAGSNTVAELSFFSTPAILVPLPNSPGDHQGANARWFESIGLGCVVDDSDCSASALLAAIIKQLDVNLEFATRLKSATHRADREYDASSRISASIHGQFLK